MAVVAKMPDGTLSVKEKESEGPVGIAVGALVDGLAGLLRGGPVGAPIGAAGGALIGVFRDLGASGMNSEFLEKVSQELTPGKTAIVAEVSESRITPLDSRMDAIGGILIRDWRPMSRVTGSGMR